MRTTFLVAETVYLRPLESEDGPAVAPWFREAELGGQFANGFPISE